MPCHSMDSLETCVKIPLEPEILTDVVEKAKDFCLMHGKFSSYISYQNSSIHPLTFFLWLVSPYFEVSKS